MDELTNIEVLVFENEDGSETEMQIVDEFEWQGNSYVALLPLDVREGDDIQLFCTTGQDEYEQVADSAAKNALLDILEERLLNKI